MISTATSATTSDNIGSLLREWRMRRRRSQMDLALDAGVSQRHLSFVESGRSSPSRDMVETLCQALELPLRERNLLLLAAGFSPAYPERTLSDPAMQVVRETVQKVLDAHRPHPALAVDRQWRMVMANEALSPLLGLVSDPSLIEGSFNVLRASLHPAGLAPHILNLRAWRDHLLHRLRLQIDASGDPQLSALERELSAYPVPPAPARAAQAVNAIAAPMQLRVGGATLSFISTTTVFGTPLDVTLSELAIETFFPADEATAAALAVFGRPPPGS